MRSGSRRNSKKVSGTFTDASRSAAATTIEPVDEFKELRARLLKRGHSLRSFALTHGYAVGSVYSAAKRTRAGKKSVGIFQHICDYIKARPVIGENETDES